MIYLDSSLVVALLTQETNTAQAEYWLAAQPTGFQCYSAWVTAEVESALAVKVRTGAVSIEQRARACSAWQAMCDQSLLRLGVLEQHFEAAAIFSRQAHLGLRAADALHLAIAAQGGHIIATLDKQMATAALELGISVATI